MSESSSYKPGDQVNGYVLTAEGQWVPVNAPRGGAQSPSTAAKIGMGILWIAVVGWILIGTALGLVLGFLAPDAGQLVVLGPIAGIGIGIYLFMRWLRAKT